MQGEILWRCDTDTARKFTAILEQAEMGSIEIADAVDQVRRLPDFPREWEPGTPVRMIIKKDPRPIIEIGRRSMV